MSSRSRIGNVIALLPAMARPRCELAVAHGTKLAPKSVAGHQQLELVPNLLRQIA